MSKYFDSFWDDMAELAYLQTRGDALGDEAMSADDHAMLRELELAELAYLSSYNSHRTDASLNDDQVVESISQRRTQ